MKRSEHSFWNTTSKVFLVGVAAFFGFLLTPILGVVLVVAMIAGWIVYADAQSRGDSAA